MNVLFIYAFSPIFTKICLHSGRHRCVFATFRREFAHEPVAPLYVHSKGTAHDDKYNVILTDDQIISSFEYSRSIGAARGSDDQLISLGRSYEQFLLNILENENIDCIVNWNLSYGFQRIADLLARNLKLASAIVENGFFRPFTVTVETQGETRTRPTIDMEKEFHEFLSTFKRHQDSSLPPMKETIPAFNYPFHARIARQIRQRFWYNHFDGETPIQQWLTRILKTFEMVLWKSFFERPLPEKFVFFPLQVATDTQIVTRTKRSMNEYLQLVLQGFLQWNKRRPEVFLVIKEHPFDQSRRWYREKWCSLSSNISWTTQPTHAILKKCTGVVTINSTVGIEGLCYEKPVVTLGPARYADPSIVVALSEPLDPERIANSMETAFQSQLDPNAIHRFLRHLYFDTQISTWGTLRWDEAIGKKLFEILESS